MQTPQNEIAENIPTKACTAVASPIIRDLKAPKDQEELLANLEAVLEEGVLTCNDIFYNDTLLRAFGMGEVKGHPTNLYDLNIWVDNPKLGYSWSIFSNTVTLFDQSKRGLIKLNVWTINHQYIRFETMKKFFGSDYKIGKDIYPYNNEIIPEYAGKYNNKIISPVIPTSINTDNYYLYNKKFDGRRTILGFRTSDAGNIYAICIFIEEGSVQ